MTDHNCEIQQDNSLQNLIDAKNEDGNLEDILDTIFTFYEDFLNDDINYLNKVKALLQFHFLAHLYLKQTAVI